MKVTQACLTLCNPMDYTVRGILQAGILEWVAFPFSRGSDPGLPHCRQILYQLSHKGRLCDQTGDYISNAVPSMSLVEINPTSPPLSFIYYPIAFLLTNQATSTITGTINSYQIILFSLSA